MLGEYLRRVWYLLNRQRFERELDDEMHAHREMMSDAGGFGSTLRLREQSRESWGWNWLDGGARDLRLAARTLRRTPWFTITSCLILSLGIGLNLAFFQLINVTLLRPLPVKDPYTLLRFYGKSKNSTSSGVPYAAAQYVRRNNAVLSAVLTETPTDVAWEDDGADRLRASFVSANWFNELGYGPALGRVFQEEIDELPDAPPAVVLSHELWRTRLGGDPDIAGKTIRLNNRPVTVCGVARADFPGLKMRKTQLWMPIHRIDYFLPGTDFMADWKSSNTDMYGRLLPHITPALAKDALRSTVRELVRQRPDDFPPDYWLDPLLGAMRFETTNDRNERRMVTSLVLGLTSLVLLVACSNLANLTLCRALGRVREMSVRTALGASRSQLLRHLAAESCLLAVAGAAGGVAIGYWASRVGATLMELPSYLDFAPDARMALAALAAALLTMLAVGILPAWRISRHDLNSAMKDGGQQASSSLDRTRLRSVLIAAQVAGSCLLLAMAGMIARGFQRMMTMDPGFSFENVAVLNASLVKYGMKGAAARDYWAQTRQLLSAHPEAEAMSLVSSAPLGTGLNESVYPDAPGLKITHMHVEPEFFDLMRVKIVRGRNFAAADGEGSTAIISQSVAREMYGTLDVIGRSFPKSGPGDKRTIVGVAADAHLIRPGTANVAELYEPLRGDKYEYLLLLARARSNPAALLGPMRQAARVADDRVLAQARMMKTDFERTLRAPRLASGVASAMALLALALAVLGIFGVASWSAVVRKKEIGVRIALGAGNGSIVGIVLHQLVWPTAIGAFFGLASAAPVSRLFAQHAPLGLALDATAYVLPLAILLVTGALGTLAPALRALRTDPLVALRHE